jgi:hypothetical protein
MTFTLHVDTARWRAHLDRVRAETPGLVPVAKGNGYGLGLSRLATEAARLGVDTLAVGLPEEVSAVRETYDGSVLVLTPYHPQTVDAPADPHVIRTVSHIEALRALAGAPRRSRVVVELATSMRRHGIAERDWPAAAAASAGLTVEGVAVHLPLASTGTYAEAERLVDGARGAGLAVPAVWVSHLSPSQVAMLADVLGVPVRLRTGTRLWLGDRAALQARGTVLDVHELARGDRYGYRQRRALAPAYLLVVSGGTAHGVGLEAPKPVNGMVSRAKAFAAGGLEAAGLALSPFHVAARQRWFAEPPHMQVSLVLLPRDVPPPAIGAELDCDVRMTISTFDRLTPH